MLSVFILAILIIALLAFWWYGWKNHKFSEHYGIYLIVSGLAIVLLMIHVFKREQYQNLMPIVAGDVIIGADSHTCTYGAVPFVDLVNFRSDF